MKKKRFAMAASNCSSHDYSACGMQYAQLQIERYYRKISGEFVHDHDL